jgi:outer membrane receptor for ferrienterochelin and colicins
MSSIIHSTCPMFTRTKVATLVGLSVSLNLGISATAWSATEGSTEELQTMVVSASGYDQTLTDAAASVTVIKRDELESHYYRDVTDALKSVPGVVVTGGGDNTEISLRGMGAKYTLILLDGKRVATGLTRPNSDGPGIEAGWMPPLEAIERIEVIKGPMSTLYGSDAIGGVINVITRKMAKKWSGKVQLSTVLQENRDSGDEQSQNIFLTGPLSDNLSMQIFAQQQQREEDNITNGYADKSLSSIGTKMAYQLNDDHEFIVAGDVTRQARRQNSDKSYDASGTYASGTYTETKYGHTDLSLTHKGNWQSVGKSETFLQTEQSDNPSREITLNNTEFKSTLVTLFSRHSVTTGVQIGHEKLNDETTNTGGDLTELSNTTFALFAEDEWQLMDDLALTGGVRYDHDQRYGSNLSPRLYSVWNIDDEWTLKGGVSTGFRAPEVRQSSSAWVASSRGGDRYGNPDLKPENSVTEEVSVHYQNDSGLASSLGVFNNNFNDMISTQSCTAVTCDTLTNSYGNTNKVYINVDKAVTRGVEASIEYPITDSLETKASYTYTYSKQETGDAAGDPLNNLPKHLLSAEVSWATTDSLDSWAKFTYHGEESADEGATSTPYYTFVDAGMTYSLTKDTTLKAAIYNLLDEDVDYDSYGYVEDGRRYWFGVDIGF